MEYFIYNTQEAELEFGKDKTLNPKEQISQWAINYIKKHIKDRGLNFEPIIKYSEKGKPFFPLNPQLYFSISHTNRYIALCFDSNPIGIDIEKQRICNQSIANRFFHKNEADYLSHIIDKNLKDQDFTKIWTLKEAYVKAIGTGISNNFKNFYISLYPKIEIHNNPEKTSLIHKFLPEYGIYLSICIIEN